MARAASRANSAIRGMSARACKSDLPKMPTTLPAASWRAARQMAGALRPCPEATQTPGCPAWRLAAAGGRFRTGATPATRGRHAAGCRRRRRSQAAAGRTLRLNLRMLSHSRPMGYNGINAQRPSQSERFPRVWSGLARYLGGPVPQHPIKSKPRRIIRGGRDCGRISCVEGRAAHTAMPHRNTLSGRQARHQFGRFYLAV